jgi:hypothetical protein
LTNVVEMRRRKCPADPDARRQLAELALEMRANIREARAALKLAIAARPAREAEFRTFFRDKTDEYRLSYQRARQTFEMTDGFAEKMLERYLRRARLLHGEDFEPRPAPAAATKRAAAGGLEPWRR